MHKFYLNLIEFLVIAAAAVHIINGEISISYSTKYANNSASECSINSLYSWQCDNGQCIHIEELCDGIVNCLDMSDETVDQCLHMPCPDYAFKCAYGGCITGNYKCNAIVDCVDGSDETRFLCNPSLNYTQEIRGSCWLPSHMQCESGDCISNEKACDGTPDCTDGSDETVAMCSFLNCPPYSFRCGYGACVSGAAKCNGVKECMDGADESPSLCGNTAVGPYATTERPPDQPPLPTRRPTTTPTTTSTARPTSTATQATTKPATSNRPSNAGTFCSASTLLNGISTVAWCMYNKYPVSCFHSLRSGTTAEISCAAGYKRHRSPLKDEVNLVCDEDGEWNNPKFKCFPRCGELTVQQRQSDIKPWDVTISRRSYTVIYRPMCSGVIVSAKHVLTAGNCMTPVDEGYALDHVFYNVIEGYYSFSYDQGDRLSVMVHNISRISIQKATNSPDLAILTLVNYFRFGDSLKPICLPSIHNKLSFVNDTQLNIGRAVSRDTSREYLEFIIARVEKVERGRRTTSIEYIRIDYFVPYIKKEVKLYRHIL